MDHLNTHTGKRPYECKYCGCKYAAKYAKNDHIKRMHADEDFKDDEPDLKAIVDQLQDNSDTALLCLICFKEYSLKGLIYHYNTTHNLKGKLNLEGSEVDLSESEKEEEESSKYSCQDCKKKFKHRYDLNRHMWLKHKSFPYNKCELCNKVFLKQENLKAHAKLHRENGVNGSYEDLRCGICDLSFMTKFEIQKHLFEVHLSD